MEESQEYANSGKAAASPDTSSYHMDIKRRLHDLETAMKPQKLGHNLEDVLKRKRIGKLYNSHLLSRNNERFPSPEAIGSKISNFKGKAPFSNGVTGSHDKSSMAASSNKLHKNSSKELDLTSDDFLMKCKTIRICIETDKIDPPLYAQKDEKLPIPSNLDVNDSCSGAVKVEVEET